MDRLRQVVRLTALASVPPPRSVRCSRRSLRWRGCSLDGATGISSVTGSPAAARGRRRSSSGEHDRRALPSPAPLCKNATTSTERTSPVARRSCRARHRSDADPIERPALGRPAMSSSLCHSFVARQALTAAAAMALPPLRPCTTRNGTGQPAGGQCFFQLCQHQRSLPELR